MKLLDEEMDGVASEQRERLETIEEELEEVKRRLGRIWQVIETTDIEMADASERIREHRDRKEKLEVAAEEARRLLKDRRQFLDSADTIATFAEDMSAFLKTSELTQTRAFVHSFVKEIEVKPGTAAIVYSIPTPEDSPIGGADAAEIALTGRVRSSVRDGGPAKTELRTRTKGRNGLCQKPCAAFLGQLLCLHMRQPVTPITMGMRVSMTAQNCPSASLLGDRELNQFQKNRMNTATAP